MLQIRKSSATIENDLLKIEARLQSGINRSQIYQKEKAAKVAIDCRNIIERLKDKEAQDEYERVNSYVQRGLKQQDHAK